MTTWQYIALGAVAVLLFIGGCISEAIGLKILEAPKPLWLNCLIYSGLILFIIWGTWYAWRIIGII